MQTNQIMIQSERLVLKPFTANDANESYAHMTPTLTRYMAWESPQDHIEFEVIWREWLITIADGSDWIFVVRNKINQEFLGLVGLHDMHQSTPELGIWIRED